MLINFSVKNYKSIKERTTLNLVSDKSDKEFIENIFSVNNRDFSLLKNIVLFGANASGKSNIFKAINFMCKFVINSNKNTQTNETIDTVPFLFDSTTEKNPSIFEITFLVQDNIYRYSFELDRYKIYKESLYLVRKTTETPLFERKNNEIEVNKNLFKEGSQLQKLKNFNIRDNSLFLSAVAQLINGEKSHQILQWFSNIAILDLDNLSRTIDKNLYNKFQDDSYKKEFLNYLKVADLAIEDISFKKIDLSNVKFPKSFPKEFIEDFKKNFEDEYLILLTHKKHNPDNSNKKGILTLSEESAGTQQYIGLIIYLIEKLRNGGIVFVDELDLHLHPLLTEFILKLFNSNQYNKRNAQLICSAHTTMILKKCIRRDQIFFIEKDQFGSSHAFSLDEFVTDENTKIRKDESYEKNYIVGKYGAVPFIGDLQDLLETDG